MGCAIHSQKNVSQRTVCRLIQILGQKTNSNLCDYQIGWCCLSSNLENMLHLSDKFIKSWILLIFGEQCRMFYLKVGQNSKLGKTILASFSVFLPLVTMIICYIAIFIKIRLVKNELQSYFSKYNEKDIQVLKIFSILFASYLIATMPFLIMEILYTMHVTIPKNLKHTIYTIQMILFSTQPVLNTFVYAFHNKVYKPAYIKLYRDIRSQSRWFNSFYPG